MIRQLFIASLVVTALTVAVSGWISFSRPLVQSVRLTPRLWVTGAVFDGRARLFLFSARKERILSVRRVRGPRIDIVSTNYPPYAKAYRQPLFATVPHQITLGNCGDVGSFGLAWRQGMSARDVSTTLVWFSFIRAPIVVLVAALLAYPCLALLRGPVRRRRRVRHGLCAHCGYNLTGLSEPRCPECGSSAAFLLPDTPVDIRAIS